MEVNNVNNFDDLVDNFAAQKPYRKQIGVLGVNFNVFNIFMNQQ